MACVGDTKVGKTEFIGRARSLRDGCSGWLLTMSVVTREVRSTRGRATYNALLAATLAFHSDRLVLPEGTIPTCGFCQNLPALKIRISPPVFLFTACTVLKTIYFMIVFLQIRFGLFSQ